MRKAIDIVRGLIAAVVGVGAAALVLGLLVRYVGGAAWLPAMPSLARWPSGSEWGLWGIALGVSAALVALYAAWFDGLLGGAAPVRGLKFGILTACWCIAIVALAHYSGIGTLQMAHGIRPALTLLGMLAAHGLSVGVVYGAGRVYDEYRSGLAYGLSDRPLLSMPPAARPSRV